MAVTSALRSTSWRFILAWVTLGAAYRNRTDDLRITSVFSCVARRFKVCPTSMSAGCCRWWSLAVDGGSGASRGHAPGHAHGSGEPANLSLRPKQMLVSKQFWSAVGTRALRGVPCPGGGCVVQTQA